VDSLLAKLFEGDDSSFYARMAVQGGVLIVDEKPRGLLWAGAGRGRSSIPPSRLIEDRAVVGPRRRV
jgi:hypothetical protein